MEEILKKVKNNEEANLEHLGKIIEFLKVFVDKCHHGKEEGLLFPLLENMGIRNEGGPIGVMLSEHNQGREYIRGMTNALEKIKSGKIDALSAFSDNAEKYIDLLRNHIEKENNILFNMADNVLDISEQSKLYDEFEEMEENVIGKGTHEKFHDMIKEYWNIYLKHSKG